MDELIIAVTTSPFGANSDEPMRLLGGECSKIFVNDIGKKFSKCEHIDFLKCNPDMIVAGTEKYDKEILDLLPNLKLISRVGIGVDGIDLDECQNRHITVCNTPDAPSNAVAELAILQMLNMLRKIQNVSESMLKKEKWNRYIGREIKMLKIGIIGMGRIGSLVVEKLNGLTENKILINDIIPDRMYENIKIIPSTVNRIYEECDIITIHIPLKDENVNNTSFIARKELNMMKSDVRLLNLSRGGIINEQDLYEWLKERPKACCALDAFEKEPYHYLLCDLGNTYLTPHIGSCTIQSRYDMECQAAKHVSNYIFHNRLENRIV